MAEKKLTTRILLKYDSYTNWKTNNPVLRQGELAVVAIDIADVQNKQLPPVMFKVGVGETGTNFNDLDWVSAKAADVYGWAKAAGLSVEDTGTGDFVTNLTWANDKLTISRGSVNLNGYATEDFVTTKITDAINSAIITALNTEV